MKNGVPMEIAFAMDPAESLACAIGFREMEGGGRYDWDEMAWVSEG